MFKPYFELLKIYRWFIVIELYRPNIVRPLLPLVTH